MITPNNRFWGRGYLYDIKVIHIPVSFMAFFCVCFRVSQGSKGKGKSGLSNTGLSHMCIPSKSKLWDCTKLNFSTSKLRSSSSFFLSRSSNSLACFLNPGLTSSRASSCNPGTWVNEGFNCCLEGVVEAQIFWAGATVLGERKGWWNSTPRMSESTEWAHYLHPSNRVPQPATFAPLTSFAIKVGVCLATSGSRHCRLVLWNSREVLKRPPLSSAPLGFKLFSSFLLLRQRKLQLCKPFLEYELWIMSLGHWRVSGLL